MDQSKPIITSTAHILPFERLSWQDFERLCLWLVEREGYERARHLGLGGKEQGRDVVAFKPAPQGEELWYFQCKQYRSIGAATLKKEVDKYLDLAREDSELWPDGVVFVVSCAVPASVEKQIAAYCDEYSLAHEFWAQTELDMRVKYHSDILAEFFQPPLKDQVDQLRNYIARAIARSELRMARLVQRSPAAPDQPYKFLYPFEIEDEEIFFGRAAAAEALYGTVFRDRLTVLHAKSGAGKTSLLNAGLSPRLIREGYLPVHVRVYDDPVRAIKRAIAPPSDPWPNLMHNLTLHEFLGLACKERSNGIKELVLILDQFEEFLVFWPEKDHRKPFIDALAECYEDRKLPIRFVIGIRGDYFTYLATFQDRIPHIFHNQCYLESMVREEAEAAITGPVAKLDRTVTYNPLLLGVLLNDLMMGELELPHLQIICTHLYGRLATGETTITLEAYKTSGGARGVLSRYLVEVLGQLLGRGADVAKAVLAELVSSQATKRILSHDVLAARVEAKHDELKDVLTHLVDARLLRREEVTGEIIYEMAHEYLVDAIMTWIDREDLAFKQAEELLAREVVNWRLYGTLIPKDRLELLYQHRERFRGLDGDAWTCILHSALRADFTTDGWGRLVDVNSLIVALGDQDSGVVRGAAKALGDIGESAVEPLIAALADKNSEVVTEAAKALGKIGQPAVEPLIAALADENSEVVTEAANVLAEIGESAVEPLIAALADKNSQVITEAANALRKIGEPAIVLLITTLTDGNSNMRRLAVYALGKIGEPAVKPLIATLGAQDWHVRSGAAKALGKIGDTRAVQPLVAALSDGDSNVRQSAARALGEISSAQAVGPLIVSLGDLCQDVHETAAYALGKTGEPAVELLIIALGHSNPQVRLGAARALGEIGEPAVKSLIATLRAQVRHLHSGAASVLEKIGEPAVELLIAALNDEDNNVQQAAVRTLGAIGDRRAVQPLIAALSDEDSNVRRAATMALGKIGDPKAVQPLIVALGDEDRYVRQGAAASLGMNHHPQAIQPLIAALKDENRYVRQGAASSLGRIHDPQSVAPLIAALEDESWYVRSVAAWALGKIGDAEAVESLVAALGDRDSPVRRGAASSLGRIHDPQAVQPLIAALEDEIYYVRSVAAEALGKIGDAKAVESLVATLGDRDSLVRRGAAEALGNIRDIQAVAPLIAALKDESRLVRSMAAEALGNIGDIQAVAPLIAAMEDGDSQVRVEAATALRRIGTPQALAALLKKGL